MDDTTRRTARTKAGIAFAMAGLLLVLNVVLALAWRDERRDRIDDTRASIERRIEQRWGQGDGPNGPWDPDLGPPGDMAPGGMGPGGMAPGPGPYRDDTDQDGADEGGDTRTDQGGDTRTEGTAT